jgi:pimeloyl-ACP methyl ester carboxylesterase
MMADDAAALLQALDISSAHVVGFSGGSLIAQELALRTPRFVRSLVLMSTFGKTDAYFDAVARYWHWMVEAAPSEREMLEAFFLWIYTARAHADGTVERMIEDALAFPHKQSAAAFQRQLAAFNSVSTLDRLPAISVPTLVLAGGADIAAPPRLGRTVADAIPGAAFEIMPGEAHQPFQEVPDRFNARVDAFWRAVESGAAGPEVSAPVGV